MKKFSNNEIEIKKEMALAKHEEALLGIEYIDSFDQYLIDIGEFEVLSKEEEQRLGYLIQNGNEDAKVKLYNHNLKLVVYIAKNFSARNLSILDLVQSGNIGLIKAVVKYDPARGFKFSTYATHKIKREIILAIKNNDSIRIPIDTQRKRGIYNKFINTYMSDHNEEPDINLIKSELNFSNNQVKSIYDSFNAQPLSSTILFDETKDDSLPATHDISVDDNNLNLEQLDRNIILLTLKELLTIQEYYVLYYHVFASPVLTFEEIGKQLKISKQWVDMTNRKALEKAKILVNDNKELSLENIVTGKYSLSKIESANVNPRSYEEALLLYGIKKSQILNELEYYIFYNKYFSAIRYKDEYFLKKLNITKREFDLLTEESILKIKKNISKEYLREIEKELFENKIRNVLDLDVTPKFGNESTETKIKSKIKTKN